MPGVSEYVRDHELLAIGTVAGVIVAGVALTQLRRSPTPTAAPAASGPEIPSIADLTAAFGAGAGAASSGFQPGVDLANAGLQAGLGLGQAGLDTGATLGQAALGAVTEGLQAALGLAAQQAAGAASGSGVAGSGGGVIPGGQGTGDGIPTPAPSPAPAPSGSGLVTGATLRFSGPTTIYARTTAGYIGAHKTFGSPGLTVGANEILVPRDPVHQTGGSFWRMTSGAAAGWLVSTSNPAVTVSGGHV